MLRITRGHYSMPALCGVVQRRRLLPKVRGTTDVAWIDAVMNARRLLTSVVAWVQLAALTVAVLIWWVVATNVRPVEDNNVHES